MKQVLSLLFCLVSLLATSQIPGHNIASQKVVPMSVTITAEVYSGDYPTDYETDALTGHLVNYESNFNAFFELDFQKGDFATLLRQMKIAAPVTLNVPFEIETTSVPTCLQFCTKMIGTGIRSSGKTGASFQIIGTNGNITSCLLSVELTDDIKPGITAGMILPGIPNIPLAGNPDLKIRIFGAGATVDNGLTSHPVSINETVKTYQEIENSWVGCIIEIPNSGKRNLVTTQPTEDVKIYPNPAQNIAFIQTQKATLGNVEIRTIQGKLVKALYTKEQKIQVSTADFAPGIYLISTSNKGNQTVNKLVVRQ